MERVSVRSAFIAVAVTFFTALAPASTYAEDLTARGALPVDQIDLLQMPGVDADALFAEDLAAAGPGVPMRFALPLPVFLVPASSGTWETLDDGSELWRLRVESRGALSLNFGFTRYEMPVGGSLTVRSLDGSSVVGPYTAADNKAHGELWTPLVLGDTAIIEVRLPAGARRGLDLELSSVNHGYRDFFQPDKSGACNVDVVCPEGDAYSPQIRAVARIIIGGGGLCTGFMVNNTAQDLRPLFMTADHCGLTAGNAPTLVVYWNFENSTCRAPDSAASGGMGDGDTSMTQTGATFRAGSPTSDFTIVELDSSPNPMYNVHWAGWDARSGDPTSAVAVHHPAGDEKRISFENDPTTTTSYLSDAVPGNGSHIRVEDWDLGTTEGGSSGSPLYDQNGRVVGQLHGGFAACGNDLDDWYGRVSVSWNLGLSDWLDPGDTGAMFLDGTDAVPPAFSGLIVPGFEVEVGDPLGPTTFFAVRNTSDTAIDVNASYYDRTMGDMPLRTDTFNLAAGQTLTRDVRANLTDLPVNNGFANGLLILSESGGGTSNLVGDYFQIDRTNDFATGDRLINPNDFCAQQEVRFVDFGSGSELEILLETPQGEAQASFRYTAYNQAGAMVAQDDYFTSQNLNTIDLEDLVDSNNFGTIFFDFSNSGRGYVTAKYSAFGRFSLELEGACRTNAPSFDTQRLTPVGSTTAKVTELASAKPRKDANLADRAQKACVDMQMTCNSSVSSVLTADDCELLDGTVIDFWEFSGNAGQTVTVDLESTDFDAFLFLLDPVPDVVAQNDDGGTGTNSQIVHVLGASGTWAIGANSFFPDELGDYTLTLTCDGGGVTPPDAPTNLTANAVSTTEINLFWQDNSDNETEFRVEIQTGGGGFTDIGLVSANATGATVSGLLPGTPYDFRVRARNGAGDSAYTNVASETTLEDAPGIVESSGLVVPGFEVEVGNPTGPTTFFAVRNTSDTAQDVEVKYYSETVTDTPLRTDMFNLGPQQTLTADVRGNLTDLSTSEGFAKGLIIINETGGGSSNLEGDYFRIDSGNDFAAGDRLVEATALCNNQEIRFVDFGSGSLLQVLIDQPQGPETPSFSYTAYSEAGAMITSGNFNTTQHLNVIDVNDLVADQSFGTLRFDFSAAGGGYATAKYSAFGRFSVELNGACVAATPAR